MASLATYVADLHEHVV